MAEKQKKVLITDPISEEGIDVLRKEAQVDIRTDLKPEQITDIIGEYDALMVRSQTKVTPAIIEAGKKLQVIARAGVGIDNVDVEAATRNGIVVVLKNEEGMSYKEKKEYWDRLYEGTKLVDQKHQEVLDTPDEKLNESTLEIPFDKATDDILYQLKLDIQDYISNKKLKTTVDEVLDKNKQMYYMNLMDKFNSMERLQKK